MARKKNTRKHKQAVAQSQASENPSLERRRVLGIAALGVLGTGAAAAGGWAGLSLIARYEAEHDLSQIGKGKPAIVQIHDPNCQLCRTLQKQTRRALRDYDDESFTFLVANVATAEGGALAAQYGVPHVTLLLFDGDGEMVQVVRGPTDTATLEAEIKAHMRAFGA